MGYAFLLAQDGKSKKHTMQDVIVIVGGLSGLTIAYQFSSQHRLGPCLTLRV